MMNFFNLGYRHALLKLGTDVSSVGMRGTGLSHSASKAEIGQEDSHLPAGSFASMLGGDTPIPAQRSLDPTAFTPAGLVPDTDWSPATEISSFTGPSPFIPQRG